MAPRTLTGPMETTDVLVIGGGPSGAAAAITLAKAGARCVVCESQSEPAWKIGETLAPESRQLLQALGEWDNFQTAGHLASPGNVSVWGGDQPVAKDFIFNPQGCAWQLDRPRFEDMLLRAAAAAGAQVVRGDPVSFIQRGSIGWEVTAGGQNIRAIWLVDATGRGSTFARQWGVTREILDQLVAIYALIPSPVEVAADARTWIEAGPGGWWYSALTPGRQRIFSFQTDADLLPGQAWRTPEWFQAELGKTSHLRAWAVGHGMEWPAPKLTSAQSSRLAVCRGEGWVAVGDAAQSFDPLSGEGLFHALLTGRHAAQGLLKNLAGTSDGLGEYAALTSSLWTRFLRQRQMCYASETRWRREPFWQCRLDQ